MGKSTVLVIVGPTASGKSAMAVKLAKKFSAKWGGAEIISADSRQVYKGMDLGSGKITKKEMAGIPHHLLDVANPKRQFSVAQYQKLANKKIAEILKRDNPRKASPRGKFPIICGGTGFYIQSIVDNLVLPEVPPNKQLRKRLKTSTTVELFNLLRELDPERAKTIDAKNPHRLIRAIEIATALGKVPKLEQLGHRVSKWNFIQIGIEVAPEVLRANIHKRLLSRMRKGMVAEAELLHKNNVKWEKLESFGLEYKYCALFLQNKITKQEMLTGIERDSWLYVKRQLTWFRRDKRIHWVKSFKEASDFLAKIS